MGCSEYIGFCDIGDTWRLFFMPKNPGQDSPATGLLLGLE